MKKKLVIYLVLPVMFLASCGGKDKAASSKLPKGVVSIKGFEMKQTVNGKVKLIIVADEAQIFSKENNTKFYVVTAKYFEKDMEISNLASKEGLLNNATNDVEVTGSVVLRTKDGSMLETEKLSWQNKKNMITTDAFVRVTKGGNVMTGIGLESDMQLENITIKKVATKITDVEGLKKQ